MLPRIRVISYLMSFEELRKIRHTFIRDVLFRYRLNSEMKARLKKGKYPTESSIFLPDSDKPDRGYDACNCSHHDFDVICYVKRCFRRGLLFGLRDV